MEKGNYSERRLLIGHDGTSGPIRSKLIERPVKADHLTIEVIESAKAEIAMFPNLSISLFTFEAPQSGPTSEMPGSDSGEDKVGLRELRDFMIDFNPAA